MRIVKEDVIGGKEAISMKECQCQTYIIYKMAGTQMACNIVLCPASDRSEERGLSLFPSLLP